MRAVRSPEEAMGAELSCPLSRPVNVHLFVETRSEEMTAHRIALVHLTDSADELVLVAT